MKCPHCGKEIDNKVIAKHLAKKGGEKGGKLSRRTITKEQQEKMQAARDEARKRKKGEVK